MSNQTTTTKLVAADERVLVVGSLNANPDDRSITRNDIVSVQMLDEHANLHPLPFFNGWGELGVSSMTWRQSEPEIWYCTTGIGLRILDLRTGQLRDIDIPKTRGIHEIAFVGDVLWLSNTYFDEIIAFDPHTETVLERLHLSPLRSEPEHVDEASVDADDIQRVNKFHCNQVFETYEGELYALVHHVSGEQLIKRIAQKLIKSQGNGGVLDVRTGKRFRLALKAPHSVRKINNQYWIFDSGHMQINVYDRSWKLVAEIPTCGWGRGGDRSKSLEVYYAGISAGRKRYANALKLRTGNAAGSEIGNTVQFFDIATHSVLHQLHIPNVEQINNIYTVPLHIAELLKKLPQSAQTTA